MLTGSNFVSIRGSVGNASYMANSPKSIQKTLYEEHRQHSCAAVYERTIPPMVEASLYSESNARVVLLVTLHKNYVKNC